MAHQNEEVTKVRATQDEKKRRLAEYKLAHGCQVCGYHESAVALDFHHIGGKDFQLGRMTHSYSWERIMEEVAKCVVLCANCHRRVGVGEFEVEK